MSGLMLHGILNAPCGLGDIVGVTQLKGAAGRASKELKKLEQENAELREALQALVKVEHERGGTLSASGSFQYPVPEGVFRQAKELLNK